MAPAALRQVAARAVERVVPKGGSLHEPENGGDMIWFVRSGLFLCVLAFPSGSHLTVGLCKAGDIIDDPRNPPDGSPGLQFVAHEDARAVGVPRSALFSLLKGDEQRMRAFFASMETRLGDAQRLRTLTVEPARIRVIRVLMWLHGKLGRRLPFLRREIAEMAGLPRETTIRALGPVQRKGWARGWRGGIEILQPASLTRELRAYEQGGK
jgi:CRP-like cAMP-binding protein